MVTFDSTLEAKSHFSPDRSVILAFGNDLTVHSTSFETTAGYLRLRPGSTSGQRGGHSATETSAQILQANQSPSMTAREHRHESLEADGIRPLRLAPGTQPKQVTGVFAAQDDYGSGGSGGSGGGTPAPNPIIQASGGGSGDSWGSEPEKDANGNPIAGKYTVINGVPVGAKPHIEAIAPTGWTITSYAWSGGTDYASYFSDDPSLTGPPTLSVTTGVVTNASQYSFLVDADARAYTVSLHVTYSNNQTNSSTLTFTSLRPFQAELQLVLKPREINLYPPYPQPILGGVEFDHDPNFNNGEGVQFEATTTTNTFFGGEFFILQLVNASRRYIDGNDLEYSMTGFDLLDDGYGVARPIGMELDLGSFIDPTPTKWSQAKAIGPRTPKPIMQDVVTVTGNSSGTDKVVHVYDEQFRTYLMYKPTSGVWVPLSRVDWSWSAYAYRVELDWELDEGQTSYSFDVVTPIPATSGDLWPSYDGWSSELTWELI